MCILIKIGCVNGKHNTHWRSEMCIKMFLEKFKLKKHFNTRESLAYLDVVWNMSEKDISEIRLEGTVSMENRKTDSSYY